MNKVLAKILESYDFSPDRWADSNKFPIRELRQAKADLENETHELFTTAQRADRELNEDETHRYKKICAALEEVRPMIEQVEADMDREREEGETGAATIVHPDGSTTYRPALNTPGRVSSGRSYREMFYGSKQAGLNNDNWKSLDEFLVTVHSHLNDPRLRGMQISAALSGAGEKFPSEGGFFVPEQFAAEILDAALEQEIVRPRASVTPMSTSSKKIAGFDSQDHSGGTLFGNFKLTWLDEGGSGVTKIPKTRAIELHAHRAAIYTMSSQELLDDAGSFEAFLRSALIQAVAFGLDDAFLNGSGAGRPKGVLNDNALIVVAKEGSQAADTINYENIKNMFARLHPASITNSVWVTNSTAIPELLSLVQVVQNVAGTENVGGSSVVTQGDNGEFKILTRPVLFTEKVPVLGDEGDLLLADFRHYAIGMRKELSIDSSIHVGWSTGEVGFRAIVRVDGQGRWSKAFQPKNGSTTSWCVTLAERT
jgi:HK97 family phage major capsid protein